MTFIVPSLQKFHETSSTLEHGIYYNNLNLCSGPWWLNLVLSHGSRVKYFLSPLKCQLCFSVSIVVHFKLILFYLFMSSTYFSAPLHASPLPLSTLPKEWGKLYFKYKCLLNSELRVLGGVSSLHGFSTLKMCEKFIFSLQNWAVLITI